MKIILMAPLLALTVLCAGTARADLEPVDCGSTSFAMSGEGYLVDCERTDDSFHVGESSGSSTTEVMSVTTDDRTIFMTMVGQLITAPRIYMEHRGLKQSFEDMFNEKDVTAWKSIGRKDGYEVAEFTRDISGSESHCITVQRYGNPLHVGFKRHIVGMGCTTGDVEAVYKLLEKIDAPGD